MTPTLASALGQYPTELHDAVFGSGSTGSTRRGRRGVRLVITASEDSTLTDLVARLLPAAAKRDPQDSIRKLLDSALDEAQLTDVQILLEGKHTVSGGFVVAGGQAEVEATGKGIVLAFDHARVVARDDRKVFATDDVELTVYDRVVVDASGRVEVVGSYGAVHGQARDKVHGVIHANSVWTVAGECSFDAHNAQLYGEDTATMRGYGGSRIRARGKATAQLFGHANGWFSQNATGQVNGSAVAYYQTAANITLRSQDARMVYMESAKLATAMAWPEF